MNQRASETKDEAPPRPPRYREPGIPEQSAWDALVGDGREPGVYRPRRAAPDGDLRAGRSGLNHTSAPSRPTADGESEWSWELTPTASGVPSAQPSLTVIALALAGIATALWAVALPGVAPERINGWGLLPGLPAQWYLAFSVSMASLIITVVATGGRLWLRAVPFVIFCLIVFGTTSVVYKVPRYAWTYKHIGVTEYLLEHGVPALDVDIYQNFPGFFYLAGIVHQVTTIPLTLMARYSELGFALLNAVAVYWAIGALSRSVGVRGTATVLFTLTNWIGQNYFAPQAIAFPCAVFVIGGYLRLLALNHGRPRRGRLWSQLSRPQHEQFWASPLPVVLILAVFAFIVVSHQFTPVALLLQVLAVSAVLLVRLPWLVVVMGVFQLLWMLHAYPFISRHFSLLQFSGYDNIRPPEAQKPVLPGTEVMAQIPHALVLFVVVGTIAGALLALIRQRAVSSVLLPGVLAAAPIALVFAQSYGQEGILRAYLFALPWCCLVIARDLLQADRLRSSVIVTAATVTVLFSLALLLVPSTLGNELTSRIDAADVAADRWFERNTPDGSELLLLVPAYPSRSTGNYTVHVLQDDPLSPALLHDLSGFSQATKTGKELYKFTRSYVASQDRYHDMYLALGPTQEQYLRLYGLVGPGEYQDYVSRLSADKTHFELVYSNDGSYLFKAL
jgi:hypothetical protein